MSSKQGYILVVEDDKESRLEAEKILQKQFTVSLAENAEEALEIIKKRIPDVLLLEADMPVVNGFEFMKLLQANVDMSSVPVIFLTTDYNQSVEVKGFEAGAQDFIRRPFVAEIMIQRVSRVLELSRLQNDLQKEVEKETRKAEERRRQVERLSDQIISALAELRR